MRAVHVVATIDEPTAGPSLSVRRLVEAERRARWDVSLHTVDGWRGTAALTELAFLHRHPQDFSRFPILKRACLSSRLSNAVKQEARSSQVIHSHGLWLAPNLYPLAAVAGSSCAMVVSPRGALGGAALAFSSRRKRLAWGLFQKRVLDRSRCIHATSEAEMAEIRALGIDRPICVVPNGVDVPAPGACRPESRPTVLSLGRIHPKKSLIDLVRAWKQVEDDFPDWRLRIAGPDENGHAVELMEKARALGLKRLTVEGPLLDDDKATAYREADLFVLPSSNENFAMTVAEALAAGTPVISTKGAPWSALESEGCGWWVDTGSESIAAALRTAMTLPRPRLDAMGRKGRDWMARDFGWDAVALRMIGVYEWLAGRSDCPADVRFA